ncbi:MAG: hypothetical protein VXZ99_11475, partial [Pseudomonadota bacterium]|nr:hypothetical protein [Pseudomonadota bacterium]
MISIAIRRTLALTAIFCVTVCVGVPASAQDTAAIPIGRDTDPQASLPTIIPAQDAALYRRIFELQQDGKWRQADKLIKRIDDRLLMGHVLYQRYMHPTKYRSRYVELKAWLKEYADHPGARRTFALAMRRKPHNWRAPQRPLGVSFGPLPSPVQENAEIGRTGKQKYGTRAQRRHARYITRQVKSLVRRGRPTRALERLQQGDIKRRLHAVDYDQALAIVVRGYYHAELDEKALRAATPAIKRSGAKAPMALWWSGLAAWRSGDYARSAENFEMLSAAALEDDWIESAAAFWAARAYLAARQPARVNPLLALAAQKPRTFYGLLAARALGEIPVFEWELPKLGT